MVPFNILVIVCLLYAGLLFLVAYAAERRAEQGRIGWLRSPLVYTLSLSIYCTAWTFYGAVGYAARSGLEFVTIYLGPTLVLVGWWWIIRKLVRIGRTQRITSIADLISSRYGKSNSLGVIVTLMAVIGTTPYIALQLQSVSLSFAVFANEQSVTEPLPNLNAIAIWVATGLAFFTILFGTRSLDANEQHHGVVTAIALEAIVKLAALLAVGIFVVWGVADGPVDILERIQKSPISLWEIRLDRWTTLIFLAAAAFVCLPRMFQVLVVENVSERHLATASWAFPLYLFLMSLFVVPIAVVGLSTAPAGANPDMFVLTLPLAFEANGLAMLAFLGGFSSATSMVIVATIALSTMVSNHIVMPIWLAARSDSASLSGDVRHVVLLSRRISIGAILALGYLYFRFSGGGTALAAIGLISFTGVVQVLPALLGGLFWRGATRVGATAGLVTGFSVWAYSMFIPSLGEGALMSASMLSFGPWGLSWLRPQALFGISGMDPLVHAVFWSLVLNSAVFTVLSLLTFPKPLERLQSAQFVNVFDHSRIGQGWSGSSVETEDLLVMVQRIIGPEEAQSMFRAESRLQGHEGYLPEATPDFIERLERELTGSVGAATAHAMLGQITGGASVSVHDLMAVADETAQMLEYSNQLEVKSDQLTRTARQLQNANKKLKKLSIQKDAFLSQISHELRTPMTSIRAFSEILMAGSGSDPKELETYSKIIYDETIRLTRLLDDLLDLSVLENGQVILSKDTARLDDILSQAIAATGSIGKLKGIRVIRKPVDEDILLTTDIDRLQQVFMNLISNANKYCDAIDPELEIKVRKRGTIIQIDFIDNGEGIPADDQGHIFEKFSRRSDQTEAGGVGLGLAISREIMLRLGGEVSYLPGQRGAAFRVTLPDYNLRNRVTK